MKTLIYRRSWSFCCEILVYIKYFYKSFYAHDYKDGFQEKLTRADFEKYVQWVAEDYEEHNATCFTKYRVWRFEKVRVDCPQNGQIYPQAARSR